MATFTNQATLSYNNNVKNSNIATGELLEVLTATKTAVMDDYVANDDVTFVISIVNTGTVAYNGLTITDDLGGYTFGAGKIYPLTYQTGSIRYHVNGVLQAAPTVTAGPPMVITGINVPAGGNAIIIFEVQANQFAPLGVNDKIDTKAVITGGGLSDPLTAPATITTEDIPNLTISKTVSPSIVVENGQLTYTFIILNTGNTAAVAADNVSVTDTFDPILDPIKVTFNGGAPWVDPGDYSYDNASGKFKTVAGKITVPAATFTQDPINGNWVVNPGVGTLAITGTV